MLRLCSLLYFTTFFNCTLPRNEAPVDTSSYPSLIQAIEQKRIQLNGAHSKATSAHHKDSIISVAHDYLLTTIADSMYHYWDGTDWDFHGTTNTPRVGEIACGYFISTLLKHAGFNLNRYTLAQQPSSLILKSVCLNCAGRKWFKKVEEVEGYMSASPKGIYIVGLDNHAGFIVKTENGTFFMHSTYLGSGGVMKEELEGSDVLRMSKVYVIGNVLGNPNVIRKWLAGERIVTLKS